MRGAGRLPRYRYGMSVRFAVTRDKRREVGAVWARGTGTILFWDGCVGPVREASGVSALRYGRGVAERLLLRDRCVGPIRGASGVSTLWYGRAAAGRILLWDLCVGPVPGASVVIARRFGREAAGRILLRDECGGPRGKRRGFEEVLGVANGTAPPAGDCDGLCVVGGEGRRDA